MAYLMAVKMGDTGDPKQSLHMNAVKGPESAAAKQAQKRTITQMHSTSTKYKESQQNSFHMSAASSIIASITIVYYYASAQTF